MKKHTLLITTTALAFGIALSVPAFAQSRSVNDGGAAAELPAGAKLSGGASKSAATASPTTWRSANDGGPAAQAPAAQLSGASAQNKPVNQAPAVTGRSVNDGGSVQ